MTCCDNNLRKTEVMLTSLSLYQCILVQRLSLAACVCVFVCITPYPMAMFTIQGSKLAMFRSTQSIVYVYAMLDSNVHINRVIKQCSLTDTSVSGTTYINGSPYIVFHGCRFTSLLTAMHSNVNRLCVFAFYKITNVYTQKKHLSSTH